LTQAGVAIPIEAHTPSSDSEGPFVRYTPERIFLGTRVTTMLPRMKLATNKISEEVVVEKGRTHK